MNQVWLPEGVRPDECHRELGVPVDGIIARLAGRQEGNVHVAQLRRLGVTREHVRVRRRSGQLHRDRPGLYLVGRVTQSPGGRRIGEVLRSGAGAVLAGRSTLVGCGLLPEDRARPVDIVIPARRALDRAGVSRVSVRAHECTVVDGVMSMTVPRALLHLAAIHGDAELRTAWREAAYRRRLHMPAILRVLDEHHGTPGTRVLRELHAERAGLIGLTANEFEDRMRAILLEAGMPEPRCNQPLRIAGTVLRPDLHVVERGLVIEADGRDGHDDPERRREDARRDALYRSIGLTVVRYGWWAVTYERLRVVAEMVAFDAHWKLNEASGGPQHPEPSFTFGVRR